MLKHAFTDRLSASGYMRMYLRRTIKLSLRLLWPTWVLFINFRPSASTLSATAIALSDAGVMHGVKHAAYISARTIEAGQQVMKKTKIGWADKA